MTNSIVKRRRFPRIRTEKPVHIKKLGAAALEGAAKTRQISLGGCTVINKVPVGMGTPVELLIAVRRQQVIQAMGTVIYENAINDRAYEVGVEFMAISPRDRILLQRFLKEDELLYAD